VTPRAARPPPPRRPTIYRAHVCLYQVRPPGLSGPGASGTLGCGSSDPARTPDIEGQSPRCTRWGEVQRQTSSRGCWCGLALPRVIVGRECVAFTGGAYLRETVSMVQFRCHGQQHRRTVIVPIYHRYTQGAPPARSCPAMAGPNLCSRSARARTSVYGRLVRRRPMLAAVQGGASRRSCRSHMGLIPGASTPRLSNPDIPICRDPVLLSLPTMHKNANFGPGDRSQGFPRVHSSIRGTGGLRRRGLIGKPGHPRRPRLVLKTRLGDAGRPDVPSILRKVKLQIWRVNTILPEDDSRSPELLAAGHRIRMLPLIDGT